MGYHPGLKNPVFIAFYDIQIDGAKNHIAKKDIR